MTTGWSSTSRTLVRVAIPSGGDADPQRGAAVVVVEERHVTAQGLGATEDGGEAPAAAVVGRDLELEAAGQAAAVVLDHQGDVLGVVLHGERHRGGPGVALDVVEPP